MNELVTVHIAVLNYSAGAVEFYHTDLPANYQDEDVEAWLDENTEFSDSECYYMCVNRPIIVEAHDEVEYV